MSDRRVQRGRGGGRGRGGRRDDPTRAIITTKIFVGNLPEDITAAELRIPFEKYGNVTECDIVNDYGFVHFSDPDEADSAVGALNGTDLHGSRLRVQKSTSNVRQKPGMGKSSDCFKCGGRGHWSKECPYEKNGDFGGGRDRGDYYDSQSYADPYDNPLIERYRRTIDALHERIRYLEDLLERRGPPAVAEAYESRDPYASQRSSSDDYYSRRGKPSEFDMGPGLGDYSGASAGASSAAAAVTGVTGGGALDDYSASGGLDIRSAAGGKMASYLSDSPPHNRSRPY